MAELQVEVDVLVRPGDLPQVATEADEVVVRPTPEVAIRLLSQDAPAWLAALTEGFARL